jgi:uncharacterized protein (TIRG00374 family)
LKSWPQVLGCIIGAISLYIFFAYFFHWETTKSLLSTARTFPVCCAVFFFFIAVSLRAFKWTFILKRKNYVTWRAGYHTVMISNMVNYIFPIRFGEILKLYIIKKAGNVTYPSSVSATLIDRFSQLLVILLFLFLTPVAGFVFSQWLSRLMLVLVIFLVLSISLFVFGTRFLDICSHCLEKLLLLLKVDRNRITFFSETKMASLFRETVKESNVSEFSKWSLLFIVLLSLVIVSVDGICYYFIINAFGVSITWLQGALAGCFMVLMFILPTPPAQIGTAEMYPVLVFSFGLGLPSSIISSAAVLWHLLTSAAFVVLGLYSAVSLGVGLGDMFERIREVREGSIEDTEQYPDKIH